MFKCFLLSGTSNAVIGRYAKHGVTSEGYKQVQIKLNV